MSDLGMQRSRSDATLYHYKSVDADGNTRWALISVFVDDLLITGTDKDFIAKFKARANDTFGKHQSVTWNETVSSFLGLQIAHNPSFTQWTISAGTKINNLLKAIDVESFKPNVRNCWQSSWPDTFRKIRQEGKTPELTSRQRKIRDNFRSIVGSLIYISISCRPDIATIVNKACVGMQDPQYNHVVWIERCLAYLASNPTVGLVFRQDGNPVTSDLLHVLADQYEDLRHLRDTPYVCFSDADFASQDDPKLRSTSGFCIYLFGSLITWSSKRQTLTAKSTMEAELIAASSAADECSWMHQLLTSLDFLFPALKLPLPGVPLLVDNLAALQTANHPRTNAASKHIALRQFRIRDYSGENDVTPCIRCLWVPTKLNVADFLTKLLQAVDFARLARFLVNLPPSSTDDNPALGFYLVSPLPAYGTSRTQQYLNSLHVATIFQPLVYTPPAHLVSCL